MEVYAAQSSTNMGVVADGQITFIADDNSRPTVELSTSPYDTEALKVWRRGCSRVKASASPIPTPARRLCP